MELKTKNTQHWFIQPNLLNMFKKWEIYQVLGKFCGVKWP